MKVGKHTEEALRRAYYSAVSQIAYQDKEIERTTEWFNRYKQDLEKSNAIREESIAAKVELRSAMIKLGIDPEKEE